MAVSKQDIDNVHGILTKCLELVAAKGTFKPLVALDAAEKCTRILLNIEKLEQMKRESSANKAGVVVLQFDDGIVPQRKEGRPEA